MSYLFLFVFEANLWSILTLSSNVPTQTNQSPLSSLSISVLLVLVNHCTSPPPPKGNPYRTCISSLSGNNNCSKLIQIKTLFYYHQSQFFVAFTDNLLAIYQFLGDSQDAPLSEEKTLLMYHLIHCNSGFKTFLLARTDIEVVV